MNLSPRPAVVVRVSTELHPEFCGCSRCQPWQGRATTAGLWPSQVMWLTLADDEPTPEGWKRAPC